LGYGAAAALALSLGLVFMLLGLLRLLQTEWTRSATGSLSWLAYLITFVVAALIIAVAVSRVKKATLYKEPK
jgi:cytosine/uracil/thiamine/allantoin permease